jgi:hypothetical protein
MKRLILISIFFLPLFVSAQTVPFNNVQQIVTGIRDVVRLLGPIVYSLAIIFFFWGVGKYALASGNPKSVEEGKGIMIWGAVAIAVMSSLYGLVLFLQVAFGVTNRTIPISPTVPNDFTTWNFSSP